MRQLSVSRSRSRSTGAFRLSSRDAGATPREATYQALKDGEGDEYLRLRAREHAILRKLTDAEAGALDLRRQSLQERYTALAEAETRLQAKYEDTVRRNQEKIRALNLESQAAASAYYAAVREARVIEQELREIDVVL